MFNQKKVKSVLCVALVLCMMLLAACGGAPANESKGQQTGNEPKQETPAVNNTPEVKKEEPKNETPETKNETPAVSSSDLIKKIQGASDEQGIYTIIITLSDKVADKGEVEMVYYGAAGTPQENSVVNTFLIQYEKDSSGKYEIKTFFDGNIDQSLRQQDQVKVNNTFGANLRAGKVVISYTADGGEKQEIYSATADQFKPQ